MTQMNAALRAGIDNVYAKFGDNGIVDIGLQSALDVGVAVSNYVQVPRCCIKGVTLTGAAALTSIANGPSGVRVGKAEPIIISDGWKKFTHAGVSYTGATQAALTSGDLGLLAVANLRAAIRAGWEERYARLVASAHVMAFLLGALESGGEWVIVDDPDVTSLTAVEVGFLNNFEEVASSGALICAMGAINHYTINHTTGQGKLQGFAMKVAGVLNLDYPTERTQSAEEKRRLTTDMLYAAAHPVSKRNMMYTLRQELPHLTAAWAPGVPQPKKGQADEFLRVRLGGIPAGARKLYVTVEACRRIASSGLLCAMPGVGQVQGMRKLLATVEKKGAAAHVGASYYLQGTGTKPFTVDQNRDEFKTAILCAGAYMKIVAPRSTLAESPAFTDADGEAEGEFGDWVAECRAYSVAMKSKVEVGLADVIGKYSAGVEALAGLEQMHVNFDQIHPDDAIGKKEAARALIREACKISKELFEQNLDDEDDENNDEEEEMEHEEEEHEDASSDDGGGQ